MRLAFEAVSAFPCFLITDQENLITHWLQEIVTETMKNEAFDKFDLLADHIGKDEEYVMELLNMPKPTFGWLALPSFNLPCRLFPCFVLPCITLSCLSLPCRAACRLPPTAYYSFCSTLPFHPSLFPRGHCTSPSLSIST